MRMHQVLGGVLSYPVVRFSELPLRLQAILGLLSDLQLWVLSLKDSKMGTKFFLSSSFLVEGVGLVNLWL